MLKIGVGYEDKVWGKTAEIIHNKDISIHHLKLMAGGRCSIHYHKYRSNYFYVTKGRVLIETWGQFSSVMTVLSVGETLSIPVMMSHRFTVLNEGEMYETYYPKRGKGCDRDDIVRIKEGYMANPEELDELLLLFT